MKKVLLVLSLVILTLTTASAGMGKGMGKGHGMRHANPLPNLMRVAIGNAELLNISGDQLKRLQKWTKENRPKMMMLVQQVMHEERMLHQEALGTDKDVMTKAKSMLDARLKIIETKTACRAYLRSVLSKKQYAQVVSIYQSLRGK